MYNLQSFTLSLPSTASQSLTHFFSFTQFLRACTLILLVKFSKVSLTLSVFPWTVFRVPFSLFPFISPNTVSFSSFLLLRVLRSCVSVYIYVYVCVGDRVTVLICLIDMTVRKVKNEVASCPEIFNVADFPGSSLLHLHVRHVFTLVYLSLCVRLCV